jgi:DNA-binding NarL/FixJ family response regulator
MISIGILEDNVSLRQTVEDYLVVSGKFFVVFSEGNFNALSKREFEVFPDIVLLDIHLSDVNGIDVISNIKKMFPETYVVIITGDKDKEYILKAIEKGACGYLYKPFNMTELETMIATVQETGSFLEPDLLTKLFGLINKGTSKNSIEEKIYFTQREKEILELLKKGHTYNEMADILCVSFHTINHHIKNLYTKANVKSKSELIVKFFRNDNY